MVVKAHGGIVPLAPGSRAVKPDLPKAANQDPLGASRGRPWACRNVIDGTGKQWQVREVVMAEALGAPARGSLIAHSEMVIRRFWKFPSTWFDLTDAGLLALIEGPAQPHPSTLEPRG